MLSDADIVNALRSGELDISPTPTLIQPASMDLTLDLRAGVLFPVHAGQVVGLDAPPKFSRLEVGDQNGPHECDGILRYELAPGGFVLMSTAERVGLSASLAARVEGRSTLGRMGLTAHVTAGFIDPGFRGTITLELANLGPWAIQLCDGMRIAQLCFYRLSSPAERPYGHPDLRSKYQDQKATTAPRPEKS